MIGAGARISSGIRSDVRSTALRSSADQLPTRIRSDPLSRLRERARERADLARAEVRPP